VKFWLGPMKTVKLGKSVKFEDAKSKFTVFSLMEKLFIWAEHYL
jgi:hypothetical protein